MAGFRVQAVHAARRSQVKQAHGVLHDATDAVAAEAARLIIDIEMRMRRGWLGDQRQPTVGVYPEPPPMVGKQAADEARWNSPGLSKTGESPRGVAPQATFPQAHPNVVARVFGQRTHQGAKFAWLGRHCAIGAEPGKSVRAGIPSHQLAARGCHCRRPYAAERVFENAEYIVVRITFRLRRGGQIGGPHGWKTQHSIAARGPPFSAARLQKNLPPAPSGAANGE